MDDSISRQAAIETVKKHYRVDNDLLEVIAYEIEALPSAQLAQDLPNGCTDTISRAAALSALNGLTDIFLNNLPPTIYKADAVEAVKALPSATDTNVGGNLIDRGAALDALDRLEYTPGEWATSGLTMCKDAIKALPPEQPGWIPVTERLPEENVYVLVWCGEVKIARIIRGISKEQRAKMQEGAIDDPVSWGWNLSNGYFIVKRSESYRTCDEYCNNKAPYCWDCIYGKMHGQDVKAWMPLPTPYREGGQDGET